MILVSRRPALFRHAEHFHNECGPYQLRAVLNALGKDALPTELYFNGFMRKRDWSLPFLMPRVLKRSGIQSRVRFWRAGSFKKHAIAALARGEPVLLVVRSILGNARLHWISLWGYDETTGEFLCYDSQAPGAGEGFGNARYAVSALESALPWRGTFAVSIRHPEAA